MVEEVPDQEVLLGLPGNSGGGTRDFFQRTATATAPTVPSISYNSETGMWGSFGDWSPDVIPGSGGAYIWRITLTYTPGADGQRTVTPNRPSLYNGTNGFSYRNYYHANTANTVSSPTITYNGTAWTEPAGWSRTIPTTPAGSNVFAAPVQYQEGISGQTVDGVVLFGTIPGSVAPPPSRTTYSNGFEYGIANGQTPSSTLENSAAFTLAVGESHTTPEIDFPDTTASNTSYFIRLPAGLTLVSARESVDGTVTSHWVRVGATQVWTYFIGFGGSDNLFSFTIRRDS